MKKISIIILLGAYSICGCTDQVTLNDQVTPKCYTGTVIEEYHSCTIMSKGYPYKIIIDNSVDSVEYDAILTSTLPNQYKITGEVINFNIQNSLDTMMCLTWPGHPQLVDIYNVSKSKCDDF